MQYEDLIKLRRQEPFRPFRVKMNDGRAFAVVHPELMLAGHKQLTIGFPRPGSDKPYFFERYTTVYVSDIEGIEFLEPQIQEAR